MLASALVHIPCAATVTASEYCIGLSHTDNIQRTLLELTSKLSPITVSSQTSYSRRCDIQLPDVSEALRWADYSYS